MEKSPRTFDGGPRTALHQFVTRYRADIIARTNEKLAGRPEPADHAGDLEHGVPVFLTQLVETLRREHSGAPFDPDAIGDTAARHGASMLARGFTVSQVVHTYGDVCQAVTEAAIVHEVAISTEEFHTLNRCLDTAIAEAVTEHARVSPQSRSAGCDEQVGHLAHESRNHLNAALMAFESLRTGTVAVNGNTAGVLGRSLLSLRDLMDRAVADIRRESPAAHRERLAVSSFLSELGISASMDAESRGVTFTLTPGDPALTIDADPPLLVSAITNLLSNAFKFTPPGGRVGLAAHRRGARVLIDIEDECGGLPEANDDPFKAFGEQRGRDRTGLGLGLSIARKAIRSLGGDISIRNMPGKGCAFVIDLPLADCTVLT